MNDPDIEQEFQRIIASLLESQGFEHAAKAPFSGSAFGKLDRSRRRTPLPGALSFEVRADLNDARPPIWRTLQVASNISLHTLHLILQGAFDWEDRHLYRFSLGNPFDPAREQYLCDWDVNEGGVRGVSAREVRLDEVLQDPGDTLNYVYDFGDHWDLKLQLMQVSALDPDDPIGFCSDGRGAAPAEDSAGRRDAASIAEYVPDPTYFSVAYANETIAFHLSQERGLVGAEEWPWPRHSGPFAKYFGLFEQTALPLLQTDIIERLHLLSEPTLYRERDSDSLIEISEDDLDLDAAFEAVTSFLTLVGDGIKLTQSGFLPPKLAQDFLQSFLPKEMRGHMRRSESQMPHLVMFREYLQKLGLVRKSRGMLLLTKAGAAARTDTTKLWNHFVSRLVPQRAPVAGNTRSFPEDAALMVLLHTATGEGDFDNDAVAAQLTHAGWGRPDGEPIYFTDVLWDRYSPTTLFSFMKPQQERIWASNRMSKAAVLLARAAILHGR